MCLLTHFVLDAQPYTKYLDICRFSLQPCREQQFLEKWSWVEQTITSLYMVGDRMALLGLVCLIYSLKNLYFILNMGL